MTAAPEPEVVARLDAARRRVRRALPGIYGAVLGMSVLGIACSWVGELLQVHVLAATAGSLLLVVWAVAGVATLVVVPLLVAAAVVSGTLKVMAFTAGQRDCEGSQADVE